jgi:putative ABC transport system permease protein
MRFYSALLHLYPKSFRAEYGDEMCGLFARRRTSLIAAFFEVLWNALAVHGDILRHDLRYAARSLRRAPGFAAIAVLLAALGVGATTAVFSVADFVLLRSLPFPNADRLVKLWQRTPGYNRLELSPANYRDWSHTNTVFEGTGALATGAVNLVGQGAPERIEAAQVTADLFPVLGVQPLYGRLFQAADDRDGAPGTVLLSYRLWLSLFGGDSGILGRKIVLENKPYVVIGVMPPQFRFPNQEVELWTPIRFNEDAFTDRDNNYLQGVARLRPGVSLEQARAALNVVAAQLAHAYPKELANTGANVIRLRDAISQQSRVLLLALVAAALCVLLIACSNLANLLLARALNRRKELTVRTAMGAGRERLVRQLITESLLLAAAGGLAGVALAYAVVPLLTKLVPNALPVAGTPSIDLRVLGFAALLTVLTGVLFGVLPALRISRDDDLSGLREGSRSRGGRSGLRSALVFTEVTLSVMLLISSLLLLRALWKVQAVNPGFDSHHVLTLRTALPSPKYDSTSQRATFYRRVLADVRQLPGVSSGAYISFLPMGMGGGIWPVEIGAKTLDRSEGHTASLRFVTPGFFETLTIPVRQGRDVSEADTNDRPLVAVVSESFVNRYWPGQSPLGRHIKFALFDRTIVGVVGDIRVRGLERNSEPQVYRPYQQAPDGAFPFYTPKDLAVRAAGNPASLLPEIRRIIHTADPEQPISAVRTLDEIVAENTASRAVQSRVLIIFAALALTLAAIGIYGLLSFAVSARAPELAVRMALGAKPANILSLVMAPAFVLALAGAAAGSVLAYLAGRLLEAILAGVSPADMPTLLASACLAILMVAAGSLIPALRTLRIDPITALRES